MNIGVLFLLDVDEFLMLNYSKLSIYEDTLVVELVMFFIKTVGFF